MIEVQKIVSILQPKLQWFREKGFSVDKNISLLTNSITGRAYEKSTIAYKFYPKFNLPANDIVELDLSALLYAYDQYLQNICSSLIQKLTI